jgi:hypothetical protein
MTLLWWFVGTILVILSSVLLGAGLQGKEGTLWIGKEAEGEEVPKAQLPSANASNVVVGLIGILVGLAAILTFAI